MTARKITRHDMKHDEFVSFVGRITIWAEENLMTLVWGAAGILVTFGVGYAAWSWRDHTQIEGETALAQVELAFAATVGETAAAPGTESFATADEKYQTVLERADAVVEDHGSTKAAEVARYYRGLAYFEMGELEQARVHLEEFVDRNSNHFLAPLCRRKIAAAFELEGNLAEACARYRDLVVVETLAFPAGLALMDLGRCLTAQSDRVGAAEAFQHLLDDHPESPYAAEARQQLLDVRP